MKMYLLSYDEDTLTGMRLAGIEGEKINSAGGLYEAAERAAKRDTGILLITRTLGEKYPEQVVEIQKKKHMLVTQVPDMLNPSSSGDSIMSYVRDAIGITVS